MSVAGPLDSSGAGVACVRQNAGSSARASRVIGPCWLHAQPPTSRAGPALGLGRGVAFRARRLRTSARRVTAAMAPSSRGPADVWLRPSRARPLRSLPDLKVDRDRDGVRVVSNGTASGPVDRSASLRTTDAGASTPRTRPGEPAVPRDRHLGGELGVLGRDGKASVRTPVRQPAPRRAAARRPPAPRQAAWAAGYQELVGGSEEQNPPLRGWPPMRAGGTGAGVMRPGPVCGCQVARAEGMNWGSGGRHLPAAGVCTPRRGSRSMGGRRRWVRRGLGAPAGIPSRLESSEPAADAFRLTEFIDGRRASVHECGGR